MHRWPLCDSGLVALAPRSRGTEPNKIIGEDHAAIRGSSSSLDGAGFGGERDELEKRGVVLQHRTMMGLRDF